MRQRLVVSIVGIVLGTSWAALSDRAEAGLLGPSNFWECLLRDEPGAHNDLVAGEIAAACSNQFPDQRDVADKDKTGGFFSVPHAADCAVRYGKSTQSEYAAQLIQAACYQIYRP